MCARNIRKEPEPIRIKGAPGSFQKMRTVLKYPGSKWNIAPRLVELIPEHHSYVEPFFGSGAVLFNKPVSDIETINDLDHDVVNLFRCIQEDAERLSRMVMTTPFSPGYESKMYNDYLNGWEKKQFSSCAEHGKPRMETVWMNYEPDPQMKLNFSEVLS